MTSDSTDGQEYYLFERNYFDTETAADKQSPSVYELSLANAQHAEVRLGAAVPGLFSRDALRASAERLFLASSAASRLDFRQISKSGICANKVIRRAEKAEGRRPELGMNAKKRAYSEDSEAGAKPGGAGDTHKAAGGYRSDDGSSEFVSAKRQMKLDSIKRHGLNGSARQSGVSRKFVPPVRRSAAEEEEASQSRLAETYFGGNSGSLASRFQRQRGGLRRNMAPVPGQKRDGGSGQLADGEEAVDERLKNIEPRMIEAIENEILTDTQGVSWDDIAGLQQAKKAVQMAVIYPLLKPELFQGIRAPPKGLLLFGPPGTGKTLIGRCIASQAGATFVNISASSLTSKWIGEGEKMVRALFAVARVRQPTVIFIDEIDSLLTQRTDGEQEATRRIKTEFLVQLDGCGSSNEDRIILLGATNRPHELDEAARRRFPKRLYVPLPDRDGRRTIVRNLMRKQTHDLTDQQLEQICDQTDGFSGADMDSLCREAAYGPIRSIADIATASVEDVRPISHADFAYALRQVRPSVSTKDLEIHIEFNRTYGMSSADP